MLLQSLCEVHTNTSLQYPTCYRKNSERTNKNENNKKSDIQSRKKKNKRRNKPEWNSNMENECGRKFICWTVHLLNWMLNTYFYKTLDRLIILGIRIEIQLYSAFRDAHFIIFEKTNWFENISWAWQFRSAAFGLFEFKVTLYTTQIINSNWIFWRI